jgi:hypothetical protein
MNVVKTKNIGFCFGVKRAIKMVLKAAEETGGKVFTLGPIIHNPQMVELLKEKGVTPVDDVREVTEGPSSSGPMAYARMKRSMPDNGPQDHRHDVPLREARAKARKVPREERLPGRDRGRQEPPRGQKCLELFG